MLKNLFIAFVLLGCAGPLSNILLDVIKATTDVESVLTLIEPWVKARAEGEQLKQIEQDITALRELVATVKHAANVAKDFSRDDRDHAFAQLRVLYDRLLERCKPYGVLPAPEAGKLGATPGGTLAVPASVELFGPGA